MSSRPESKRRERMKRLYREGSLVSFWGIQYEQPKMISFGIVSRVERAVVHYFCSMSGRGEMNRFTFESEIDSSRPLVRVEVF